MKRFNIMVNGRPYDVQVEEAGAGVLTAVAPAPVAAPAAPPTAPAPVAAPAAPAGALKVESPMPGNILDIKVSAGQSVAAGDVLIILEAMKMENEIVAPQAGTVSSIHVNKGDAVDTGALLVSMN